MADLLQQTVEELAPKIVARELSVVELTTQTLDAIDRLNPTLNAYRVVLNDGALATARELDAELATGRNRGPLHGIPVGIKDLMDIAGQTSPAGSLVLADRVAERDATAVARLRAAGAVFVGKTSMPEFAFSPASNNDHYGTVPNPWNQAHDSGGSSSGSGAAVAVGLATLATGSDTGGSIRMPSVLCGIVGLKPTFGRVPATGGVTLSWALDHFGPMTRSVADAALMLDVMEGRDGEDNRGRVAPKVSTSSWQSKDADGLRVAVVTDDGGPAMGTPAVLAARDAAAKTLADAGAVVDEVTVPEFIDLSRIYGVILGVEAAAYYEQYLRERPDDLTEFSRSRLLLAYAYSPLLFVQAQQARAKMRRTIAERLADFDVVLLPGMAHEAPPLGISQQNTRYTGPFNALGWPALVLPWELGAEGLPVGVQIAARPWREDLVLRAATALEGGSPWQRRVPPLAG